MKVNIILKKSILRGIGWRCLALNAALAFIAFMPFVITNNGILTYLEDWNGYILPTQFLASNTVRNGNIFWNWSIDLGSDFISSMCSGVANGLFSPFGIIIALLPKQSIIYANIWILILKFAISGFGCSLYLERYIKNERVLMISTVLYTFSGFSLTILVFNLLNDLLVFFPFLMWALDSYLDSGRWKLLTAFVALSLFCNVVSFFGETIFVIIYFCFRQTGKKDFWNKGLSCLGICSLGGVIAGIVVIPTVYTMIHSQHANAKIVGSNMLTWDSTSIVRIIRAFLFPAEPMTNASYISRDDWMSTACYLPFFGIMPTFYYMKYGSINWIRRCTFFITICLFVPLLNSLFYAGSSTPYHRWLYMGILMYSLSTGLVLERLLIEREHLLNFSRKYLWFVLMFIVFISVVPWYDGGGLLTVLNPIGFVARSIISVVCLLIIELVLKHTTETILIVNKFLILTCTTAVVTALIIQVEYKLPSRNAATGNSNDTQDVIEELFNTARPLSELEDIFPYRAHFWREYYNYGFIYDIPSRTSFYELPDPSIEKLYGALGVPRNTAFTPEGYLGTNELLSCKYYVSEIELDSYSLLKVYDNGNRLLYLYEDEHALPIAYTYDCYMLKSEFDKIDTEKRAEAMLYALVVLDEDRNKVEGILKNSDRFEDYDIDTMKKMRSSDKTTNYKKSSTGFSFVVESDSDKYVFLSVPHSSFWKAYLDGKEQDILDVNGLMAIQIHEGKNTIVFSYNPILTITGLLISIIGIIVYIISSLKMSISNHCMDCLLKK